MMHASNPLEQDIVNLFENNNIHVNDMRDFFAESVCEMLDDGMDPMAHHEAAYHIFDKWYRSLRKAIWTSGAKYTLEHHGAPPEEAEKEANTTYSKAYWKHDQKRRKGNPR